MITRLRKRYRSNLETMIEILEACDDYSRSESSLNIALNLRSDLCRKFVIRATVRGWLTSQDPRTCQFNNCLEYRLTKKGKDFLNRAKQFNADFTSINEITESSMGSKS